MTNTLKTKKNLLILILCLTFVILLIGGTFLFYKKYSLLSESKEIELNCIKNYSRKKVIKTSMKEIELYNSDKMKNYINANFEEFLKNGASLPTSIANYVNLYKNSFEILIQLSKTKTIKYADYKEIHKYLNRFEFQKVQNKLNYITFKNISNDKISKKKFFEGVIAELNFNSNSAENFYKEAISLNSFEPKYYNSLGNIYYKSYNFNEAILTFEKGLNVANSSLKKDKDGELLLNSNLAEVSRISNNFNNSMRFYTSLLINSKNYNNTNYEWIAVYNLGSMEANSGNYITAENYLKYALKLANKNRNNNQIANSLNLLSKINYKFGDYSNGKKNSLKAIKIAKKSSNLSLIADASFSACLNYEYLGKSDLALIYCKRAIKINEGIGKITQRPEYYIQNGYIYSFVGSLRDYKVSLENYKQAYNLSNMFNLILLKSSALSGISDCENMLNQREQALSDLKNSIQIREKLGMQEQSCDSCALGFINWNKKDYNAALANYKNAMVLGSETMNNSVLFTASSHMSSIYSQLKNYEEALKYSSMALEISKKIYRFDHHYIRYQQSIQSDIMKNINKK